VKAGLWKAGIDQAAKGDGGRGRAEDARAAETNHVKKGDCALGSNRKKKLSEGKVTIRGGQGT